MSEESLMPERDEIWAKHDGLTPALAAEMLAFAGKMEMERNEARIQLASERALADQLAAIVQRSRDGHGGMLTDPECFCEDCEHLRVLDAALDRWNKARLGVSWRGDIFLHNATVEGPAGSATSPKPTDSPL